MPFYLKSLVDTVIEARTDYAWWRPVLASLLDQPAAEALPSGVLKELRRFLSDGKSATRSLSELWTQCFRALESGKPPPWRLPNPPEHLIVRTERHKDWNQLFALNELAVVLGGIDDEGLRVRDPGIADLPMDEIAVMLRRLLADLKGVQFEPRAVLAHDREALPIAMALARIFGSSIEPMDCTESDCLYVFGNLTYAGALERARMTLEQMRPRRTLTFACLLTENPNALRLLPDLIGLQTGSGALPWGKAAGLGVLLRAPEGDGTGDETQAVADPEAFERSRDKRSVEQIARDLTKRIQGIPVEYFEDHSLLGGEVLRRILERKTRCLQRFEWRVSTSNEELTDWYTLLPPFPHLLGTPFSDLPPKPTVTQLRETDPEEEQLRFMDWVTPTLQNPLEVWVKEDVTGRTYTHYITGIRDRRLSEVVVFVVETVPYGEDTALNNFTLFLRAEDADELRFGKLIHSVESSQAPLQSDSVSLN